MSIERLYFGKDDAETDFTRSGLLRDSFLETIVYREIKQGNKTLVIGRKGSGKSALCLMLNKQLCNEASASIVTPDAISAEEIRRFELLGINEQQSKKLVWRYVFLTQICKFLVGVARQKWGNDLRWPEGIKKIRQFLVDNREVDDLSFQEKFWKIINRINASLTFGAFGQTLEISARESTNPGLQLGSQLDFLESYVIAQLETIGEHRLFILIDKIDEIWNDDPSSCQMVIGLLLAAKEINVKFERVRCIVFLRSDIYEELQFFDKDKLRGDEIAILWNKASLPELILARARISTGNLNLSADQFWASYFPSRVEHSSTSDFLISHTLLRPRDIIQLCNLCADLARREGTDSILQKHILQALDVYSSWKLNDLIGEYRINYPFLNDLLIIFSNTSFVLPRQRLESVYKRVRPALQDRYPNYEPLLNVDSVLNILYGIGFLGVERNHRTIYSYDTPGTVEEGDNLFIIHPAFRYALKSTSSVDLSPDDSTIEIQQRRYLSEIYRGRSPVRQQMEPFQYKEMRYFLSRLRRVPIELNDEAQVPAEVANEIGRVLRALTIQLEEVVESKNSDMVQVEIIMMKISQYLSNLMIRMREDGFLSPKSDLSYRIEELIETTRRIRERLYIERW